MTRERDDDFGLPSPKRARSVAIAGIAAGMLILGLPALTGWVTPKLDYGNLISATGLLFTIIVLLVSVVPGVRSLAATARMTHYSQLDSMYQDILKMAVEKPYLRIPRNLGDEQQLQYESYAFIVWNFLETVRDRCDGDNTLQSIWGPVIANESALHKDWFYRETVPYNQIANPKFRLEFADFVWREFWLGPNKGTGNTMLRAGAWISGPGPCRERQAIAADENGRPFLGASMA